MKKITPPDNVFGTPKNTSNYDQNNQKFTPKIIHKFPPKKTTSLPQIIPELHYKINLSFRGSKLVLLGGFKRLFGGI